MKLIVGLGNPGKKYEQTRHNVGLKAIEEIVTNFQLPIFKFQSIFNAQISKGKLENQKIILVKPLTFMNNSGQAVQYIQKKHKIRIEDIVIIHDDLDIPLGKIRVCQNRSAAGHQGVQSIINYLKNKNFVRIRIGIKPENKIKIPAEKFVLKNFPKQEKEILKQIIQKIPGTIFVILKKGITQAMNEYNH